MPRSPTRFPADWSPEAGVAPSPRPAPDPPFLEHRADVELIGGHEGHGFALQSFERIGVPRDLAPGNLGVGGRDFDRVAVEVVGQLRVFCSGITDDPPGSSYPAWLAQSFRRTLPRRRRSDWPSAGSMSVADLVSGS